MPDVGAEAPYDCTIWGWRWGFRPSPRDGTDTDLRYVITHKFSIELFFNDGSQDNPLNFCEELDPIQVPAKLDFCDIMESNGIQCP